MTCFQRRRVGHGHSWNSTEGSTRSAPNAPVNSGGFQDTVKIAEEICNKAIEDQGRETSWTNNFVDVLHLQFPGAANKKIEAGKEAAKQRLEMLRSCMGSCPCRRDRREGLSRTLISRMVVMSCSKPSVKRVAGDITRIVHRCPRSVAKWRIEGCSRPSGWHSSSRDKRPSRGSCLFQHRSFVMIGLAARRRANRSIGSG